MGFEFPSRGLVFWPVCNGDSTTIVIDADTVVQVDLHHLEKSEDDADPTWSVVDELVARLPKKGDRPYLAVFALTHPDQDHSRGFEKLLERIDIGELWFTPRVFFEYHADLCDDAKVFQKEAKRRVKATISAGSDPGAGNRVRLFGYSELLEEDEYKGFPEDRFVIPGNAVTTVDDVDVTDRFRAFVHAPFKDHMAGERNETSLGLQVTLYDGDAALRALLFGDLAYPTLKRIFEISKDDDLAWNVLLAPHHCSKKVMYWQEEGDEGEKLKQDILDMIEAAALDPNHIVSSSDAIPASNSKGDNPPHAKAKSRYEGITTDGFICTMEHPNTEKPEPVTFKLENGTVKFAGTVATAKSATAAATIARGGNPAPGEAVTYGKCPKATR